MQEPRRIVKLEQTVVNRIAAGEIIQRPANALKELLENSIDAQATSITVTTKDGGLKLLQIQDNGVGIAKEDLGIVCERFTTSKLAKYEDLLKIGTFGFRGEASYSDGVLVAAKPGQDAQAKPCAGNIGTLLTVEDLFYNVDTRRKALTNHSDEYNRILDVMQKYAIHYSHVGFTCKKVGATTPDLCTGSKSTKLDAIRTVFSNSVASELLTFEYDYSKWECKAECFHSNANYSSKKQTFLLFINNRLVESSTLKKGIDSIYNGYLPKQMHSFVYLSLNIKSEWVDVNVHPTKREVNFLNEVEIVACVCESIEDKLKSANQSRRFMVQTTIDGSAFVEKENASASQVKMQASQAKVPSSKLVRTDSRMRTLDSYISTCPVTNIPTLNLKRKIDTDVEIVYETQGVPSDPIVIGDDSEDNFAMDASLERRPVDVNLTSILNLRTAVVDAIHDGLYAMIKDHTFVGVVDEAQVLIQHRIRLMLVNYKEYELFYGLGLKGFNNYGSVVLEVAIDVYDAVLGELNEIDGSAEADKKTTARCLLEMILDKADLLIEHFNIVIDANGMLSRLPLMLSKFAPDLALIPALLVKIGRDIDWDDEELCFDGMLRALAVLYGDSCDKDNLEHVVFPAMKLYLFPSQQLERSTRQVADLQDLYKVFERC